MNFYYFSPTRLLGGTSTFTAFWLQRGQEKGPAREQAQDIRYRLINNLGNFR